MITATAATKAAIQPRWRFWTPSSCSIISSARFSAASLISAAGWWMRATSSLMCPLSTKKPRQDQWSGLVRCSGRLFQLGALLVEVLDRARMPRQRRSVRLLVLDLEVLRFLVHADQLVAMV